MKSLRDFSKLDSVPAPLVFGHTTTLPFSISSSISQPGDDHSAFLVSSSRQSTGYKLLQLYKHLGNRALARKKHVALLTLARKLQFASPHFQRSAPGDPCGFIIATVSVCRAAACTGTISDLSTLFLYRELSYAVIGRTGRRKCNILESHVKSA